MSSLQIIRGYYLATPLFFLFDAWWGWSVRATFVPDPVTRFGYYVVVSGLGLLTHFKPGTAPWVAMGESSLNLLLIVLWIMVPLYSMTDPSGVLGPLEVPYTPNQVLVNGLLAGSVFVLGFYRAQGAILARYPWLGGKRSPGSR